MQNLSPSGQEVIEYRMERIIALDLDFLATEVGGYQRIVRAEIDIEISTTCLWQWVSLYLPYNKIERAKTCGQPRSLSDLVSTGCIIT